MKSLEDFELYLSHCIRINKAAAYSLFVELFVEVELFVNCRPLILGLHSRDQTAMLVY